MILEAKRGVKFEACLPPTMRFELDEYGQVTDSPHSVLAADPRPGADGECLALAKVAAALTGLRNDDLISRVDDLLRKERWITRGIAAGMALVLFAGAGGAWVMWDQVQGLAQQLFARTARVEDAVQASRVETVQSTQTIVAGHARIELMIRGMTGEGAVAIQAVAEFRALLRSENPDVDAIPVEKLPGLAQLTLVELRKRGPSPNDFAGAVREALRQAQQRIDHLDFAGADTALDAELTKTEAPSRGRAALLAEKGRLARLTLRYRDAARLFTQAAGAVAFDHGAAWEYTIAAGDSLCDHGNEFGDNHALHEAIVVYSTAADLIPREQDAVVWAKARTKLGIALWRLGERSAGSEHLQQSESVLRSALAVQDRKRIPLDWAATQMNLGIAVEILGARESGTARLKEAVTAYRAALEERTRDRVPLDWAMTQNNLGNALWTLGARESGTARLDEAVAAYRAALEERTRDRVPLHWATTQNNLGNALWSLGARESGTARLEEAVAAYRAALEEWTRDRVPLDWAMTQNNLGIALQTLGERESGTARLEEAVTAYRAALEERTRARVPLDWAFSQHNLSEALAVLAERTRDRAKLVDALGRMRDAAEVYREGGNSYWLPIAERRIAAFEAALAAWPTP